VVVFVSTYASTADLISSVTYGGVALTRLTGGLAQDGAGESGRLDTFFLGSGLGTGNQTITVNRTNNATVMYAAAATVTAGANTAVPESTIILLQGDGTLTVQSVDDTSPGQNSLRYAGCYSGLNTPPTAGTGSTLLNSIDIGNYGSALVRETTAGQGARNVGFSGATDDRAAVHLAIRELVPRTLTQTVGSFTLTGNDATLTVASPKVIEPVVGAFTLTGNAADLRHNPDIEAGVGTFTLTGNAADALHNVRIEAVTGSFGLTGNDATLTEATPKAIAAETGAFTLASNGATLRRNYALTAEPGAFIASGQPATFRRTWTIQAGTGTFSFTGNPASLTELGAYEIDPTAGSFALTGNPPALTQSRTAAFDIGTFVLTGNTSTLQHNYSLAGATGVFVFTGNAATLTATAAKQLNAAVGLFTLTGQPADVTHNYSLAPTTATFSLTGTPTTFTKNVQLICESGTYTLTGLPVTLPAIEYELPTTTGTYALTGAAASFTFQRRRRVVLIF
jgi:hypothetical protein